MGKPKIVTLDIETAPLEVYTWGIWEESPGLNQIKSDWSILSYSAKVLGSKKVEFHHTGGRGAGKVRDDRELLGKLHALLDSSDILITQNGRAFDIKKINARLITSGFGPYSPLRIIDTKVAAKQVAAFTSNRLEWLSKLTRTQKSQHKKYPGFELWLGCLRDEGAAWKEMARYNKIDVIATEELFLKLRPWIKNLPNVAAYATMTVPMCPKCGSKRIQKRGIQVGQAASYERLQCQDCGGWFKGKTNQMSAAKRKSLLGD